MKKHLLTLICILCVTLIVNAQQNSPTKNKLSVILDGKLLSGGIDGLSKIKQEDVESATILKEKDKTAIFGINNNNGLLIVITKANSKSAENIALKEKIARLNLTKNSIRTRANIPPPSRDSISNGVFDFVAVEKQPEFPGGIKAFYQYLSQMIKYPKEAWKNNIHGKVFLSFIVEKDGRLTHIKIIRGLSPETNTEALRVVSASPKWSPGIQFDVPVRVKYNINVNFAMN